MRDHWAHEAARHQRQALRGFLATCLLDIVALGALWFDLHRAIPVVLFILAGVVLLGVVRNGIEAADARMKYAIWTSWADDED